MPKNASFNSDILGVFNLLRMVNNFNASEITLTIDLIFKMKYKIYFLYVLVFILFLLGKKKSFILSTQSTDEKRRLRWIRV